MEMRGFEGTYLHSVLRSGPLLVLSVSRTYLRSWSCIVPIMVMRAMVE